MASTVSLISRDKRHSDDRRASPGHRGMRYKSPHRHPKRMESRSPHRKPEYAHRMERRERLVCKFQISAQSMNYNVFMK